jgi:hypothetical protein
MIFSERNSTLEGSDEMTPTTAVHATGLVKSFGDFRAVDHIDL